jgi:hypothetical protein
MFALPDMSWVRRVGRTRGGVHRIAEKEVGMFEVFDLPAAGGRIGICPVPGRDGDYGADLDILLVWRPGLVLTMTGAEELERVGAGGLGRDLALAGCAWRHLPIRDFGVPVGQALADWPHASAQARAVLGGGGRVLVHCFGGCGRSGMAILRIMAEAGEPPAAALDRLRMVRPCAVETSAQKDWATAGQPLPPR